MVMRNKAVEPKGTEAERSPMFEAARRLLLASMGAAALAQDEIEAFVDKLVERGEVAEQDGKRLVREVMDKRRRTTLHTESDLERRVEEMLNRMNVPTKADIEALGAKITALAKKVDELRKTGT